ncbi:Uu.00g114740.m01.CDS01 [Anthostomella pinea]|uniref:Uu.00g114740.m01.CDS01 n=1 Tax=Anthostomella pinea TaxID=933095 RepID=A0AAI8YGK6_9PEZI|nr:Uu.00g114740.m01.CDS01 [Anthostomella pinea]
MARNWPHNHDMDPYFHNCHSYTGAALAGLPAIAGSKAGELEMSHNTKAVLKSPTRTADLWNWIEENGRSIMASKDYQDAANYFTGQVAKPKGWKGRYKVYRIKPKTK